MSLVRSDATQWLCTMSHLRCLSCVQTPRRLYGGLPPTRSRGLEV